MRIQPEFSVTPSRSKGIDFVSFHDFIILDVRTFPTYSNQNGIVTFYLLQNVHLYVCSDIH
jgi:hypothetical protein